MKTLLCIHAVSTFLACNSASNNQYSSLFPLQPPWHTSLNSTFCKSADTVWNWRTNFAYLHVSKNIFFNAMQMIFATSWRMHTSFWFFFQLLSLLPVFPKQECRAVNATHTHKKNSDSDRIRHVKKHWHSKSLCYHSFSRIFDKIFCTFGEAEMPQSEIQISFLKVISGMMINIPAFYSWHALEAICKYNSMKRYFIFIQMSSLLSRTLL